MPSPSGSTPALGLPYLLETDAPDVATASQLLAEAVESAILASGVPVGGTIGWELATLPPIGTWLFEHGQTVTVAAYPALAAARPSWVSGSNIVLPDTRDKFTIGAGGAHAGGATGGSATVTLTTSQIPEFSTTLGGAANISAGLDDPTHYHAAQPGFDVVVQTTSADNLQVSGSGTQVASNVGNPNTDSKSTGVGIDHITFGNPTPNAFSVLNPFYAEHKIVRAA